MKIEMKTVYIAEDGKEFDTLEECQEYESESCILSLESRIADLETLRDCDISLKNRYKANKYGKLAKTEATLLEYYKSIRKMMKVPIEKMSLQEVERLGKSINTVRLCLLQREQQKDVLEDLRHSIKEKGKLIKELYEKLVKLKVEKLNS